MNIQTLDHDPRRVGVDETLAHHENGNAVLIDIRHPTEHAYERIPGSRLIPMNRFAEIGAIATEKPVILYCRTSHRTAVAVDRLAAQGHGDVVHLDGGIEAWKQRGNATERSPGAPPLPLMQQVPLVAGSLVVVGTLLGTFVAPAWHLLSGFVGAGLAFAGLTGWCGLATLLGRMPWNRTNETSSSCSTSTSR